MFCSLLEAGLAADHWVARPFHFSICGGVGAWQKSDAPALQAGLSRSVTDRPPPSSQPDPEVSGGFSKERLSDAARSSRCRTPHGHGEALERDLTPTTFRATPWGQDALVIWSFSQRGMGLQSVVVSLAARISGGRDTLMLHQLMARTAHVARVHARVAQIKERDPSKIGDVGETPTASTISTTSS